MAGRSPIAEPHTPAAIAPRAGLRVERRDAIDALIIAGTVGAAIILGSTRPALFLPLMALGLAGPVNAIRALCLGWLVTMINVGLAGEAGGSALRTLLLLGTFTGVVATALIRGRGKMPHVVLALGGFAAYAAASAAVVAHAPDVAILKAVLFGVGAVCVIWAFRLIEDGEALERWFRNLVVTLVLLSLPLMALGAGYSVNDKGFQGLLNHPQAYGGFLAMSIAWLASRWIFHYRRRPAETLTIAAGAVSLIATESRTALLALAGSLALAIALELLGTRNRARALVTGLAVLVAVAIGIAVLPKSEDRVRSYLTKRAETKDLVVAFKASRGTLISRSLQNIRKAPGFGIGFGMPSIPSTLRVSYDPVIGLPTGASIEKGFAFVALVEETGLVGTVLFLAALGLIAVPVFRARDPTRITLLTAALLTNFGEATLFSFGGNGMIVWLFIGLATLERRAADG